MSVLATSSVAGFDGNVPDFIVDYAPDDEMLVPPPLAETRLDEALERNVAARARRYIEGIRATRGGIGGLEDFMYDCCLSTLEGWR